MTKEPNKYNPYEDAKRTADACEAIRERLICIEVALNKICEAVERL